MVTFETFVPMCPFWDVQKSVSLRCLLTEYHTFSVQFLSSFHVRISNSCNSSHVMEWHMMYSQQAHTEMEWHKCRSDFIHSWTVFGSLAFLFTVGYVQGYLRVVISCLQTLHICLWTYKHWTYSYILGELLSNAWWTFSVIHL